MELEKIRNLTDEELTGQQSKSAEQLFRLRFQKSLGNSEGIKKLRVLKLDIARIQTVARERALGIEKPATPAVVPTPAAKAQAAPAEISAKPAVKASAAKARAAKAPSAKAKAPAAPSASGRKKKD
jgi:large subunit ribosomal protein L29